MHSVLHHWSSVSGRVPVGLAVAFAASALVPGIAAAQTDTPGGTSGDSLTKDVSSKTRAFLADSWSPAAAELGLSLLTDDSESPDSRRLVLGKLKHKRRQLASDVSMRLLDASVAIARDATEEPRTSAAAVRTAASVAIVAEEKGELNRPDVELIFGFLPEIATDTARDDELRAAAIRAIGDLRIIEAGDALRGILSDPIEGDGVEVSRNALLSIQRLEGEGSLRTISDVMLRTQSPAVFDTAAYALGQIQTTESMVNLIKYGERFPDSGSADAALVDMEQVISEVLRNPEDPDLTHAIAATMHLWRDGQRDRYTPLLLELLRSAPPDARRAAAERLIDAASLLDLEAERRELEDVRQAIADQPDLDDLSQGISRRLSAKVLQPNRQGIPVPSTLESAR